MSDALPPSHPRVTAVWEARDANATRQLYIELAVLGPAGAVTVDLFRAVRNSTMAKGYRGRSATSAAYETKQWAIGNITKALTGRAGVELGWRWGWKIDPSQTGHPWVLYIDLPTGQASFHHETRGDGPDYPAQWDRAPAGSSAARVVMLAALLLDGWPLDAPIAAVIAIPRKPEHRDTRGKQWRRVEAAGGTGKRRKATRTESPPVSKLLI